MKDEKQPKKPVEEKKALMLSESVASTPWNGSG
jgi:hypothetical protein